MSHFSGLGLRRASVGQGPLAIWDRGVTEPRDGDAIDGDALDEAIAAARATIADAPDALGRAIAYGALIEWLQGQVTVVAEARDEAIMEILSGRAAPSHRALAQRLGVSPQRVDQLARVAREGRNPGVR